MDTITLLYNVTVVICIPNTFIIQIQLKRKTTVKRVSTRKSILFTGVDLTVL